MKKIFFLAAMMLFTAGISSCKKEKNYDDDEEDETEMTEDKDDEMEEDEAPKPEPIDVTMSGAVGKYPIVMSMYVDEDGNVTGAYYYKKSGPGNCLYILGKKDGDHIVINEFDLKGNNTGSFDGYYHNGEFSGSMAAKSGGYDFTLSVDDTAAPAPFEEVDFSIFPKNLVPYTLEDDYSGSDNSYSSAGSGNIDALLDKYERYAKDYVKFAKKAQKGDLTAIAEYENLYKEALDLQHELENLQGSMSAAQLKRLNSIIANMASAYM